MLVNKKQLKKRTQYYEFDGQTALVLKQHPIPEETYAPPKEKPQEKINRRLRSNCLLLFITVALLAAVVTAQSAYIVNSGYTLVENKKKIITFDRANETLRLEIAKAKTHERIAQIASQNLGMVIPQNAYFPSSGEPSRLN